MSPRAVIVMFLLLVPWTAQAAEAWELYNQGVAKKKAGDLTGAEATFRACLTTDAKYARCHFSLGVILRGKGDVGGALDHLRQAVALAPDWGQAHLSLGFTLQKKGEPEAARAEFEAALKDPKLEGNDRAEALNGLGILHRHGGRWKDAVDSFDKAIAIRGDYSPYHRHKALALEPLDDFAGMEKAARRATELAPNDAEAWTALAIAQARQKRAADALLSWRKVVEADPKNTRGWYGRGEAAEKTGDKAEARLAYERYLTLVPPNESESVRERLKQLE